MGLALKDANQEINAYHQIFQVSRLAPEYLHPVLVGQKGLIDEREQGCQNSPFDAQTHNPNCGGNGGMFP
jgi:hypothetical protein